MESDTTDILERITDIEFKIFNRWGEEVYSVESEDNSAFLMPWDGSHKGDPAPSEVYIYYISYRLDKAINPEAPTLIRKGDITLVR
jgi:gliding motility-associated-like protein